MSTEPKIDVDLQTLLVRQVSALVEATAEALHGNSDEQIRTMALLYRVLAANCRPCHVNAHESFELVTVSRSPTESPLIVSSI